MFLLGTMINLNSFSKPQATREINFSVKVTVCENLLLFGAQGDSEWGKFGDNVKRGRKKGDQFESLPFE
jgi:hypothetical protein